MTTSQYAKPIIALHWLTLILILIAVALGLYREYVLIPANDPRHAAVMSLHMSFGLVIWVLTIIRLYIRANSDVPQSVSPNATMAMAERGVHFLLYAMLIIIPLIGLASAWIRGRPFVFFGMFSIPSPLVTDWKSPTGKMLEPIHLYSAYVFLAVAGLHALAAAFHHTVRGVAVLPRILPSGRRA